MRKIVKKVRGYTAYTVTVDGPRLLGYGATRAIALKRGPAPG